MWMPCKYGQRMGGQICRCGHGSKIPGNGRIWLKKASLLCEEKKAGKVTLKDVILGQGLSLPPENKRT